MEKVGFLHIEEKAIMSNITAIAISAKLYRKLWYSPGHFPYVISIFPKWDAGFCVYPVFVIQNTFHATTQQQYALSTETYSDGATIRATWKPDVWVHFCLGYSQEDKTWTLYSKLFDQGIGEDIPKSSSSSSVIPCMVSSTGTSWAVTVEKLDHSNRSVILRNYIQLLKKFCTFPEWNFKNFFSLRNIQEMKVKNSYTVLQESWRILRMLVFMSEEQIT